MTGPFRPPALLLHAAPAAASSSIVSAVGHSPIDHPNAIGSNDQNDGEEDVEEDATRGEEEVEEE